MPNFFRKIFYLAALLFAFSSCNKETFYTELPITGPEQVFYAISGNNLVSYNAKNAKNVLSTVAISGTSGIDERILSIAFRPHTGELYALSNSSKIYILNIASGVLRAVGSQFTPLIEDLNASISFNPTTDRIRLVTSKGQNFSINPETGVAESPGTTLASNVAGAAFSNRFAGTTSTVYYNLTTDNKLLQQTAPNTGVTQEIGALGVTLGTNISFDISPDGKNAIAVSKTNDGTRLFKLDLTTGQAVLNGKFNANVNIQSIAIPSIPAAYGIINDQLVTFIPASTTTDFPSKTITGLATGETILSLDMRAINGQLFAVSSNSMLYTINLATAQATKIAQLSIALNGTSFGTDFNTKTDLLTIISNTGQSINVSPQGTVTPNNPVNSTYKFNNIAFDNNFANPPTTTAYAIDAGTDKLYSIITSTGEVTEIGDLGVDATAVGGFDIVSTTSFNTAFATLTVDGQTALYQINLSSGAASQYLKLTQSFTALTLGLRF